MRNYERNKTLVKFKPCVFQLDTPRIQKLLYARNLDFVSQAAKPLIKILCMMNAPPNYIMDEATIIQIQGGEEDFRMVREKGEVTS